MTSSRCSMVAHVPDITIAKSEMKALKASFANLPPSGSTAARASTDVLRSNNSGSYARESNNDRYSCHTPTARFGASRLTRSNAESAAYTNRFGKDTSDTQFVGYIQKTF